MGGAFILGIISTSFFKSQYSPTITIFFALLSAVTLLLLINNPVVTVVILLIYFILLFGVSNTLGN
jgi:sugar phosphate permease